MTTVSCNDNWVHFNSHHNQCFGDDEEQEEEEEEALSLCDLPTNDHQTATNSNKDDNDPEDFEFGSGNSGAAFRLPENICTADEVFFQGKILPFRRSVNRSENDRKTKIRNQFHSHPSPSPQIRTQTRSFRTLSYSKSKTTSLWSFLQVGLVKPQEIGLSDLKNRSKRSGSYNSNSSSNSNGGLNNNSKDKNRKKTKKKQRLFLGGCNCSVDSVERTIKEKVPKESMMGGDGNGRQAVTRHRTFEWLRQLSIAAPNEA